LILPEWFEKPLIFSDFGYLIECCTINFQDIVNWRQGHERAMNYKYCRYTSLCDSTNTGRLNWTDFLSFLPSIAEQRKDKLFFSCFSQQLAVSLSKVSGQLMERV
jgi:hypothetical protein